MVQIKASAHVPLPCFCTRSSRSASLRLQSIRRRHHPAREERVRAGRLIRVHVSSGQRCRALDEESPATLPNMSTRNVRAGHSMNVQGQLNKREPT
eukprot:scaffold1714_cov57-Phaeocystis_antarctica.AAC.2